MAEGKIRWAAMEGFVGHKGEGEGFFGVFGDAEWEEERTSILLEAGLLRRWGAACCARVRDSAWIFR